MTKKLHTTDTMPDVIGAIRAVERRDPAAVKNCNRLGEPIEPNRYGLAEYSIANFESE